MNALTNQTVKLDRPFHAKKVLKEFCLAAVAKAADAPLRFAQIGANDGQLADPIHPFIEQGGWQGVMVGTPPGLFRRTHRASRQSSGRAVNQLRRR